MAPKTMTRSVALRRAAQGWRWASHSASAVIAAIRVVRVRGSWINRWILRVGCAPLPVARVETSRTGLIGRGSGDYSGRMEERKRRCLTLPAPIRRRILSAASAAAPEEACGLLVGVVGEEATAVARAVAARNLEVARPSERYTLAPDDFLAAERGAREDGLEVIGFWHSHPATSAVPSRVDRDGAWEGYSYLIVSLAGTEPASIEFRHVLVTGYLIVSLAGNEPELRAWRLVGDRFEEERLAVAKPVTPVTRGAAG